jgi:3-deoxy-manno-octulosonate cytidylyltransferase (CMP-KDO synthetase)
MIAIIIPARMKSSRLPGKPLAQILGRTLISRVYDQCYATCPLLYVASDDVQILAQVPKHSQLLVKDPCFSGTDRVARAAKLLHAEDDDIIINVQGDMPFVSRDLITQFIQFMKDKEMGTAAIEHKGPVPDNFVSLVMNRDQEAIYFSRSSIPSGFSQYPVNHYQHIGLYGYRVRILKEILKWRPSSLELSESLEQLRVIENNIAPISVMLTEHDPGPEINTPSDLVLVNRDGRK